MKYLYVSAMLFVMSCGASAPASEAPLQVASREASDEDIINSLLATDISTDPLSTLRAEEAADTDTGPEDMVFE